MRKLDSCTLTNLGIQIAENLVELGEKGKKVKEESVDKGVTHRRIARQRCELGQVGVFTRRYVELVPARNRRITRKKNVFQFICVNAVFPEKHAIQCFLKLLMDPFIFSKSLLSVSYFPYFWTGSGSTEPNKRVTTDGCCQVHQAYCFCTQH